MKKSILLTTLLCLSVFVFAQGVQIGVRAGINNGNLTTKIPGIEEGKVQNGFLAGVFGRASFLGFFAQPEINYAQRKGSFEQVGIGTYTNTLNYLDVNVMLGYSLMGVVRLNVGPSLMTLLSTSQEADNAIKDNSYSKDYYNNVAWGLQMGVGFDLGKLCVDLRYDMNLSDLGKNNVNSTRFGPNTNYSSDYGIFQFSLGYKIFKL